MCKNRVFWLLLVVFLLSSFSLFAQFAGGTGTVYDPYQVETAVQLQRVRLYRSARFIQVADINLGTDPWHLGEGWEPLGTLYSPFRGTYDGDGYQITGLKIDRPNEWYQSLFGYNEGTIMNVKLVGVNVTGANRTAALAGYNIGTINKCSSSGDIFGIEISGGLVGKNEGIINNSYSHCTVSGSEYTGGLVGENGQTIMYSYSYGNVLGWDYMGGLVGLSEEGASTEGSFWDIEASGLSYSAGGEGRYSVEMKYPHSPDTFVDWDWRIWAPDLSHSVNGGYPYLRNPNAPVATVPAPAICVAPLDGAHSVVPVINLHWETGFSDANPDPPTGFRLSLFYKNPDPSLPDIYLFDDLNLGYTTSFSSYVPLQLNTEYFWKIVPYNIVGPAVNCPTWSFNTFNPSFAITYPVGGEQWQSGTTRTIRWTENAAPGDYEISISYDFGTQWAVIDTVAASPNYYHFQVPLVHSTACLIRMESIHEPSISYQSLNAFSIINSITLPKVILTNPSAEDTHFKVGEWANLHWTRQNVGQVSLDYSTDDGLNWTNIYDNLNTSAQFWLVPDTPSSQCRVRVSSKADPNVFDISDYAFSIGKLELIKPNGGESITGDYSGNAKYSIQWDCTGIEEVDIDYSPDAGITWLNVVSNYAAHRKVYNWHVNATPTQDGIIRISNSGNQNVNAISAAPFTVKSPIKLLNANGGGFITQYTMFNIRWRNQDVNPNAELFWEYSLDNENWSGINTNPVPISPETMYWFVNVPLSEEIWLRAREDRTNHIIAQSEAPLRVTDKALRIFEPNGSEVYTAHSYQQIRWDYIQVTFLNIYLSLDDGENWTLLAANVQALDPFFPWEVPDTPSTRCRIRVQDVAEPWMRIDSDLPFTISPTQIISPTVDFIASITNGDIPLSVQFYSDVIPGMGLTSSVLWDFGDGNYSNELNPLHVYNTEGTYTVSLTAVNDFGQSTTETKEDYITALPQSPRIQIVGAASLDFGIVSVGDTETEILKLKNIGSNTLTLNDGSFDLPNSPFTLDTVLPVDVLPNEVVQIRVKFTPIEDGDKNDILTINSNAVNMPALSVALSGHGTTSKPNTVDGLKLSIMGDDVNLNWQPQRSSLAVDGYIVLYNENPHLNEDVYFFLAYVTEPNYTHRHVAQYRSQMFYRVIPVWDIRDEGRNHLRNLFGSRSHKTWGQLKTELF